MCTRAIDEMIWVALTDADFRERVLNGHRREVVESLGLTEAERQAILLVKADTLESFAGALCQPAFVGDWN